MDVREGKNGAIQVEGLEQVFAALLFLDSLVRRVDDHVDDLHCCLLHSREDLEENEIAHGERQGRGDGGADVGNESNEFFGRRTDRLFLGEIQNESLQRIQMLHGKDFIQFAFDLVHRYAVDLRESLERCSIESELFLVELHLGHDQCGVETQRQEWNRNDGHRCRSGRHDPDTPVQSGDLGQQYFFAHHRHGQNHRFTFQRWVIAKESFVQFAEIEPQPIDQMTGDEIDLRLLVDRTNMSETVLSDVLERLHLVEGTRMIFVLIVQVGIDIRANEQELLLVLFHFVRQPEVILYATES